MVLWLIIGICESLGVAAKRGFQRVQQYTVATTKNIKSKQQQGDAATTDPLVKNSQKKDCRGWR